MLLNKSDHALVPDQAHWHYGALDAVATYRVGKILPEKLKEDGSLKYYNKWMAPTARNLLRASIVGIKIDTDVLTEVGGFVDDIIEHHTAYLIRRSGMVNFKHRSPIHLRKVLFEKFDLPILPGHMTPKGAPSTDEETLLELSNLTSNDFLDILMEVRKFEKLKSTYITPMYHFMDIDNFIHPKWKPTGTVTGRATSEHPATTTAPRDKEYKVHGEKKPISIRKMYTVPTGYEMAYCDMKQGELQCLAVLADDENFKEIFLSRRDPHAEVARRCYSLPEDAEVEKETRNLFKVFNFGLIYGANAKRVSHDTGVPLETVQSVFAEHRKQFPKSHLFLDNIAEVAFRDGYIESPFGTRKHVVEMARADDQTLSKLEREFRNLLPQNTCAMVMLRGYNKVCKEFRKYPEFGIKAWPVNVVYDAKQTVYKKKFRRQVREIILEAMLTPVEEMDGWVFPISFGIGENWSEAEHNTEDIYSL